MSRRYGDRFRFQKIERHCPPRILSTDSLGRDAKGARLLDRLDKALDVRAKVLLPVHWATFNLGLHDWDEPIKRTLKTAQDHKVELVTPRFGRAVRHRPGVFLPQPGGEQVK